MRHLYAGRGKAQLKIQETAFMLLGLAMLFALILIIYANMQVKQLYSEKNQLKAERAINLLGKLAAMPELSCIIGNCIDMDKALAIRNVSGYENLWKGLSSIKIVTIYPNQSSITIYDKGKKDITYSSYVPLCRTAYKDGYVWQDCDVAKLLVSVEEVKPK
ncbi:MAG: hypothetical protein V1660_03945 [archaeon]